MKVIIEQTLTNTMECTGCKLYNVVDLWFICGLGYFVRYYDEEPSMMLRPQVCRDVHED